MKKTYLTVAFAAATLLACNSGTSSNTADSTTSTELTSDSSNLNSTPGSTASSTGADTGATGMNASSTPVNDMDKQFMMDAAAGGNTEVMASQMALDKSTNDRVKMYAQMMINDHTKSNTELKSLASRKNVTLPDSPDPKKKDALESMKKLSGTNLDKQYMTMMVQDHQETVNKFQMATQKCEDNDVKSWASSKLPALKMHLDSAQALQTALK